MDESMETYTNKMSIGEIRCLLVKYGEKSILVTISCIYICFSESTMNIWSIRCLLVKYGEIACYPLRIIMDIINQMWKNTVIINHKDDHK